MRLVSVIELTLGPTNKIGRSIAERSTIEQNRKVDSLTQSKRAIIVPLLIV